MAEGRDSTPDVLFPSESAPSWLSEDERLLLTFALDTFGGPLSQFLLAGLGQEAAGQRWRFTIIYASGGLPAERHLEAISHEPARGPAPFPKRRDPLALVALLKLLLSGGGPSPYELTYARADILNLLGWEDAGGAGQELDEAVERYSLMTFRWSMSGAELAHKNLSSYTVRESVISEYKTADEGEQEGQMRRVLNRVVFSSQFIEQLKQRSLFEIDWNSVQTISRIIQQ